MKTKYGTKIVLVIAAYDREWQEWAAKMRNQIPPPVYSQGVIYTRTHNYRYISHADQMRGFRGVDVEFLPGWDRDKSILESETFKQLAEIARMT